MKTISRLKIVNKIHDRIDKTISKAEINQLIGFFVDEIKEELLKNNSVSIKNFGTFSPSLFHGHNGYNVNTKKVEYVKPHYRVNFHIHYTFAKLVRQKRSKFEKNAK